MSKGLRMAQQLVLPDDTPVHRLAFIGTYNSGKSYAAMKLAEQMTKRGLQWVAMDPMGIWWGMRLASDGKAEGMPVVIFGGEHGDVPIRDADGGLVADTIVSQGISAIIDTSQFETDAERSRFAHRFAERFYWLKKSSPSAVHLFLEEAHEYVPQNVMGGEADMAHVFNRIWKQGGNYGIGGSLITQRPQDINKKASELSALVLAFNTTGTNAVEAMNKWLKGVPGMEQLHTFKQGQCLAWSPAWLRIQEVVQIEKRETYHARFDPTAQGAKLPVPRTLSNSSLEQLRAAFAQAVTEHDEHDIKALQARIKALESRTPEPCTRCAELEQRVTELQAFRDSVAQLVGNRPQIDRIAPQLVQEPVSAPKVIERPTPPKTQNGKVSINQALLDAMKLLSTMGEAQPLFRHVGAVAGKGANAGPVRKALTQLVADGLVVKHDGDRVALTALGAKLAQAAGFSTVGELHAHWLNKYDGLTYSVLSVVLGYGRRPCSLDQLGAAIGKNINAGPVRKAINDLVKLGLLQLNGRELAATDLLFPEGLK